jgi:hypothetical protein
MVVLVPATRRRGASLLRARPQDTRLKAELLSKWYRKIIIVVIYRMETFRVWRTIKLKCFYTNE